MSGATTLTLSNPINRSTRAVAMLATLLMLAGPFAALNVQADDVPGSDALTVGVDDNIIGRALGVTITRTITVGNPTLSGHSLDGVAFVVSTTPDTTITFLPAKSVGPTDWTNTTDTWTDSNGNGNHSINFTQATGTPILAGESFAFVLDFELAGTVPSHDTILAINITGSDSVGTAWLNGTTTFTVDAQAPALESTQTADLDGNGILDTLILTFDQVIDDAASTLGTTTGWTTDMGTLDNVTTGDTADDNILHVELDETTTPLGTGATPTVSLTGGDIEDPYGNRLTSLGDTAIDAAAPVVQSAATVDSDGNNKTDLIQVVFSEYINDGFDEEYLNTGDWSLANPAYTINSISTGDVSNDQYIEIYVDEVVGDHDTASAPMLTYTAGMIEDYAAEGALAMPSHARDVTDNVDPILLSAATLDQDGDGLIDGYNLTFSESVNDTTLQTTSWIIAGRTTGEVNPQDPANNAYIILNFGEDGTVIGDTNVTPDVTTSLVDAIKDLADNGMAILSSAALDEEDGAGPVIVKLSGNRGSTLVQATLSEPTVNGAGQALATSNFTYVDNALGGASGISNVEHTLGSTKVNITLIGALTGSDFGMDTIAFNGAGSAFDVEGNPGNNTPVEIQDLEAPQILRIETLDTNNNGRIDSLRVIFTEPINDGPAGTYLKKTDWTLEAPYGDANGNPTSITSGTSNDAVITLGLVEGTSYDTDAVPEVTYGGSQIADHEGNALAGDTVTSVDRVAPHIKQITTRDLTGEGTVDAFEVTFSENILDDSFNAGDWSIAGHPAPQCLDTGAAGNDSIIRLKLQSSACGDSEWVLDSGDTPDVTLAGSGSMTDDAGNSIFGATLGSTDGVAPVVMRINSWDPDQDGFVDYYEIIFSEDIDVSSFNPAMWNVEGGRNAMTYDAGGDPFNDTVLLDLVRSSEPDTGELPYINYTASITDAKGNQMPDRDYEGFFDCATPPRGVICDEAPAILMTVSGQVGRNMATLYFSEGVEDVDGLLLDENDFAYQDHNSTGVGSLAGAAHVAGSHIVNLTLGGLLTMDDIVNDTISVKLARVYGAPNHDLAASPIIEVRFSDVVGPRVTSAITHDGDGWIDAILVTFDEDLEPESVTNSMWNISAPYNQSIGVRAGAAPDTVLVAFEESFNHPAAGWGDTNVTPTIQFVGGDLTDVLGNVAEPSSWVLADDGAAPQLIYADTEDVDHDGILDRYLLFFSEKMLAGSFTAPSLANWTIGGGANATAYITTDLALGLVRLDFAQDGMFGTGELPELIYNGSAIEDMNGTALATLNGAVGGLWDFAEPVITKVVTRGDTEGGIAGMFIHLSEAVELNDANATHFAATGCTCTNATLWQYEPDLLFYSFEGEGTTATLPSIQYIGNYNITDLVGNDLYSSAPALAEDGAGPVALEAISLDLDGNGTIDHYAVTFSEDLNTSAVGPMGWFVASMAVHNVTPSYDGDDAVVLVNFTNDSFFQDYRTDEFPALFYSDGTIEDAAENQARDIFDDVEFIDGVGPGFVGAVTLDVDADGLLDHVAVLLSEEADNGTLDAAHWSATGYDIADIIPGSDPITETLFGQTLTDEILILVLDNANTEPDTDATFNLTHAGGGVGLTDLASNPAPDVTFPVLDGAAPVLLAATGAVGSNVVTLEFNEPVGDVFGGALSGGGFSYMDGNDEGAAFLTGIQHVQDSAQVKVFLDAALTASDLDSLNGDGITILANTVYGVADEEPVPEQNAPLELSSVFEVESALTRDIDGDGRIDGILVTFTQPISDGTLVASDWTVNDTANSVLGIATANVGNDTHMLLILSEVGIEGLTYDTHVTPLIDYNATGDPIMSLSGLFLATAQVQTSDGAGPVPKSATTLDLDLDGRIDAYSMVLSEAVDDTTIMHDGWTIDNTSASSNVETGLVANDTVLLVHIPNVLHFHTGEKPNVTSKQDAVKDAFGNSVFAKDVPFVFDLAPPILLRVGGTVGSPNLTAFFSEPVHDGSSGGLKRSDFQYIDGSLTGAAGILSVDHQAGDSEAILVLNQSLTQADFESDQVRVLQNSAYDLANLSAPVETLNFVDPIPPVLVSAETQDDNTDGILDRIRLTFNEPVNDIGPIGTSDWTVKVGTTTIGISNVIRDTTDTSVLYLVINSAAGLNTAATPHVAYNGNSVRDEAGNKLAAVNVTAIDKASPVLLSASTLGPGSTTLALLFSEGVRGSGTSGRLAVADLVYDDTNVGGASSISSISHNPGAATATVTLNAGITVSDNGNDAVVPGGTVVDVNGLAAVAKKAFVEADVIAPAALRDFQAGNATPSTVNLTWLASGDDGLSGTAASYTVKVSKAPITALNFADAPAASGTVPTPKESGGAEKMVVTGLDAETLYYFAGLATDDAGNSGLLVTATATTAADDSAPTGTLSVSSSSHPSQSLGVSNDDPVFSWSGVQDQQSTITYYYALKAASTYTINTATDASTTDTTVTIQNVTDGTWTFHILAKSGGGVTSQAKRTIVIDTTAPGNLTGLTASNITMQSLKLTWNATGDDGNAGGNATSYELRYSTSAINASNFANATEVTGLPTPTAPGTSQFVNITGIADNTSYVFALRAVDEAGNKGNMALLAVGTLDDASPPVGTLTISSTTTAKGGKTIRTSHTFNWTAVTDNGTAVVYHYVLNQDANYVINGSEASTMSTSVTQSGLTPGVWYLHVRGKSGGGLGTQDTFKFEVVSLTAQIIKETNDNVKLNVQRKNGNNHLDWKLPTTPAIPMGLQIWRFNSPGEMVADLPSNSSSFALGKFVDRSDKALSNSSYLITIYYDKTAAGGYFASGFAPTQDLYDTTSITVSSDSIPVWVWVVASLVGLIVVAAIVLGVVAGKRARDRRSGEETWDHADWDQPMEEPEEVVAVAEAADAWADIPEEAEEQGRYLDDHEVECPMCDTRFSLTGQTPLVSHCPGCGRRGILN